MQKEDLEREVNSLTAELKQVIDDRDHQIRRVESLVAQASKYRAAFERNIMKLSKIRKETTVLQETSWKRTIESQELKDKLADAESRLADAESRLAEAEQLRKELHNTIMELKGNIRVFGRVRPAKSDSSGSEVVVTYPTSIKLRGRGIELMHNEKLFKFTFDRVFTHEASQDDVFVEISQLVQSALDGYKVCIFAYGQTGSGKTYTMMGMNDSHQQKGLIPRSLEHVFQTCHSKFFQGWKYKMQASILEIYKEAIFDLLSYNRSNRLDVKYDQYGSTYVAGLSIIDVCSVDEVSCHLQRAAQNRSVGETQMNENAAQHAQGILNFIDLAGNQRLSRSGATGDRLKETQAINKSLSSLKDVISAIANEKEHVPYRNSKLTQLLQPCLGGESKTLMFVNISPEASSSGESLSSLQFASSVNSCEIGIPRRQA